MKKIKIMVAIIAAAFMLNSCGLGMNGNTTNSGITGGTTTGGLGSNGTTDALINAGISILSNLLGGGTINARTITGTWTYAQPQVTFESTNVLGNIGGELMGNKIESTLKTQLEKMGLKPGLSKFTFDGNGNMTVTLGNNTTNGTYTLDGNKLTMKGALGIASLTATVTINQNQLYMLFDANTIFNIISKLGSSSSSISSLLNNFNGMKMGWSLTR